ncbi:MAG: hypothetical protein ABSG04_06255 [Verrucomicrobiota bacterium]|jgi:hypothetical protein
MRKRFLIIAGFALVAIGTTYIWVCWPPGLPSGSVQLIGYQSRQDSVVATVVLTNTGTSPLSYHDTSEGVHYKIVARVRGKETNWSSGGGPASMAGPIVVWPSRSARILVVLPVGTETWHCKIPVQGTGARIRMFEHLGKWGIWNRAFHVSQWFIRLFPMNDSDEREMQSDTFAVAVKAAK